MPPDVPATVRARVPDEVMGEPETEISPPVNVCATLVTDPTPATAQVPSPRQKVEADAPVPLLRFATGRFPVTPVVSGNAVQFVKTPEVGVPNAGVTNVGVFDMYVFRPENVPMIGVAAAWLMAPKKKLLSPKPLVTGVAVLKSKLLMVLRTPSWVAGRSYSDEQTTHNVIKDHTNSSISHDRKSAPHSKSCTTGTKVTRKSNCRN